MLHPLTEAPFPVFLKELLAPNLPAGEQTLDPDYWNRLAEALDLLSRA